MDLSYEKVLIEQHASESPGIFIPDTPAKSIPMARTLISVSNGRGIPTFKSLVRVPVSLHTPLTEQSACSSSNKMSSPPLAPMTPSKSRSAQHCNTQEVVHLDSEEVKEFDMSQNVVIEGRTDVSLSSDDNEEVEEIDLNKTPRKKAVRRKKHRPRVIQEDKPIKTPTPVTPEIAEHKDRPITKKTYVRKKKAQNCLDIRAGSSEKSKEQAIPLKTYIRKRKILNPSEMLGTRIGETAAEYADQLSKSTTKSARRTLDFGSKGEAIDERQVSTGSNVKCAAFDDNTAVWNREFNVEFVQGMEVKVTRSPVGFAFDLNRSLNEVLDEYIKLPENPTQSVQMTENGMNTMSDQKQYACCGYSDIIIINDIENTGTKKDHDHISVANHCTVEDSLTGRCFMHGNDETKQNRPFQETSGLSPYLPMIYRRRRTQRPKLSRSFSFEDAQRPMNFNVLHRLELTLPSTQRATRKRSKILTQDHKRIPIAGAEDCDHLLCSPENKNYGTQACIDALFADARFKVTTKRRRNKGHFHFVSSMLSSRKQECEIASSQFNFPQSPFVIGLDASRSNHWKYLNGIQFCSGIQRIVSSLDPVDVIAEKMKHMKLSDVQIKNTSEASNALVSYRGGSMMVPYMHLFDMIKKQRPRAKVNLDPETNRVWNLLMGKKSNGETDGVNADKEKWWEGERDVFRGRVNAFIARMHLILGDRRFSKWNGSVVDSVVGVFLTQNVSDHLSSSAFMSLAARYPLRSCGSKEANEQKMNMLTEQGDGNVSSLSDTKAIDQSSVGDGEKDKETADVHGSLGSNNRNGTYHSKENELNINGRVREMGPDQAPQNMMITAVTTTEIMELEAAEEDRMILEGAIFSKTEHVGIENVSALNEGLGSCLLPSASGITESNDINIIRSGIGPQRMPPIFTTAMETQIIDLTEEDRITLEDSILSKTQHVRKENVSVLNEGLGSCLLPSASEITSSSDVNVIESGIGSRRMPSNFTTTMAIQIIDSAEEDRMVLEDSISLKTQHVGKENISVLDEGLGSCLMPSASEITLSNDINLIASGLGSQRMPSNFTTTMATQIIDLTEEEDRMTLEDVISSKNEHVEMENVSMLNKGLGPCLLSCASEITKSYDVDIIESVIAPRRIPSNFTTKMAVELHETRSKLSVDASTCFNPQICLGQYIICHDDLPSEKIVGLLKQNDSHGLPQVRDEQPVEILKDFQAENTSMEVDTEETVYPSLCNDIKKTLETVMEAEINLKSEVRTSQTTESKKEKSASRTEKVNAKTENTKMFNWENLRREALSNSDKNERSRETMDSLDWEAVRDADVDEISKTIRERGMNNVLAGRIKDFLNRLVKDHGSIDLEWLRNVPPDRAKEYLLSIHGIGLKSVECVRLLTLHHLAFPVDTNVGRICVRLGWVPLQPLPESLQLHLLELYPMIEHIQKYLWPRLCKLDQRTLYELHYQMITFGKVFCTKTKPNCNACPMRGECKHFASAFASARLALPGPEEKRIVTSRIPSTFENGRSADTMPLLQLEGTQPTKGSVSKHCEPIIEEPDSPEHICTESLERDIEDAFYDDPEDIPTIKLSLEDFKENLKNYVEENNMEIQDGDMSKALVAITAEAASIPMPKLKNVNRLRTEHQVYELPDAHPLLEGMDQRVPDDPCPYLLAIWTPGETAQSMEPPQSCSNSQDSSKLCGRKTCFACDGIQEARAQTVRGTLLIPCRTAMKGSFPLNGTYFQVNEVFADHRSSRMPIDVPRGWIWNLPRRTVFFGTTVSTIFKGLTLEEIQHCFWRGFVCVRGFDRASRAPRPLYARLHCPPSRAVKNKKAPTNDDKGNTPSKIL